MRSGKHAICNEHVERCKENMTTVKIPNNTALMPFLLLLLTSNQTSESTMQTREKTNHYFQSSNMVSSRKNKMIYWQWTNSIAWRCSFSATWNHPLNLLNILSRKTRTDGALNVTCCSSSSSQQHLTQGNTFKLCLLAINQAVAKVSYPDICHFIS